MVGCDMEAAEGDMLGLGRMWDGEYEEAVAAEAPEPVGDISGVVTLPPVYTLPGCPSPPTGRG